jgi:HD superfamily phosphohydrolase
MSYTTTFKKFLKESREPEDNSRLVDDADDDFPLELDDIEEMSTSAGAGGYETPNAFGELGDDTIEMLGYKKVKKVKKEVKKPVKESEFMKLSKELYLNEISYNEYRKDPIASPKAKINNSINYINRGLKEIEKVVNHNVRLKQEMGVDNNVYWKSSRENLAKISERLLRVSKQLKELAS